MRDTLLFLSDNFLEFILRFWHFIFGDALSKLEPLENLALKNSSWPPKNGIALVTGGNTGIGKETAIGLAKAGFTVVITSRTLEKAQKAAKEIEKTVKNSTVHGMELDLASFKSIKAFLLEFKQGFPLLHLLVNNAGGASFQGCKLSEDGIEQVIQGNHVGVQMITLELLENLSRASSINSSSSARIINVGSIAHFMADVKQGFDPAKISLKASTFPIYGLSKLYNLLFTAELRRVLKSKKLKIWTCALHPGTVGTDFTRQLPSLIRPIYNLFFKSPRIGARTQLFLSLTGFEPSSLYYAECRPTSFSNIVLNKEIAQKLWNNTQKLIDQKTKHT